MACPMACEDALRVEEVGTLNAEQLWERFVSQRKPVLLQSVPEDRKWIASETWTNKYLKRVAVLRKS